jgi:predicted GNAT family acetyltransferase
MEIHHDIENDRVWTESDGQTASVEYELTGKTLNILHTYVPAPLEGQGIASKLVKYAYDFAKQQGLQTAATCSYARIWLDRHPEYN